LYFKLLIKILLAKKDKINKYCNSNGKKLKIVLNRIILKQYKLILKGIRN